MSNSIVNAGSPLPHPPITIRMVTPADVPAWIALRQALWPYEEPHALANEAEAMDAAGRSWVRLAFDESGTAVGLLEFSVREQAPGSGGRAIPYVEGWFVAPAARRAGVGRALIGFVEDWARAEGYDCIGSDTVPLRFPLSTAVHVALGFAVVGEGPDADGEMLRFFCKPLAPAPGIVL